MHLRETCNRNDCKIVRIARSRGWSIKFIRVFITSVHVFPCTEKKRLSNCTPASGEVFVAGRVIGTLSRVNVGTRFLESKSARDRAIRPARLLCRWNVFRWRPFRASKIITTGVTHRKPKSPSAYTSLLRLKITAARPSRVYDPRRRAIAAFTSRSA